MKKSNLFHAAVAIATFYFLTLQTFNCFAQPPPTISSFTPSSGAVGTLVTITGTNLSIPTAFTIGGATAIEVSNIGTTLVGLVMPGAVTGAVSVTTAGGTAISVSNFTVTPTPYPGLQQGNKLVGTGAVGAARQGWSVSISSDGNTAIVGGLGDSSWAGAAWVYTRTGGVWTQQGSKLVGTGAAGAAFQGISVSISSDGNTAIVGGYQDNSAAGAVWVYTRSGGVWTQQGSKLVGTGAVGGAEQGASVSISSDGNTAIVGGDGDSSFAGAAWVYTRSGGVWTQQGSKLVGTGAVSSNVQQGASVSISSDGNTAIVGGIGDSSGIGAAWVYTRTGGVWTQQGSKLVGTGAVGAANQGISVSISSDGNTAIVGGRFDNSSAGAAWVYTRSGGVWTQQGSKLVGAGAAGAAYQGISVSISSDGNTAIVGGHRDSTNAGAAWVYTRSGSVWTQQGSKLVGTGAVGSLVYQGYSVSISSDGNTAIVGGYRDNTDTGAAWVYSVCTVTGTPASAAICSGDSILINGTYRSAAGTYTDTLTAVNGCDSIIATTLMLNSNPVIISFTVTSIGCTPLNNTLCVTTTGADTLFWYFGDMTYDTTLSDTCLTHIYTNVTASPVFYNPTIIIENVFGCRDTASATVTVLPPVTAAFTASPDTAGCHPFTVDFQNSSTGADNGYLWDFGDGSPAVNDTNPTHIFTNTASLIDSIYTVRLIATGFPICKDTAVRQILVHPIPTASYTVSDTVGCVGDTAFSTNTSTGATSYLWQVDGITLSTDTNAFIIAPIPGTYAFRLIASDGVCSDTSAETIITVYALPTASITGTDLSCTAANDGAADLTASGGAPLSYNWSNGDTTEDIMGLSVGTYTVIVTDTNGCTATDSVMISITGNLIVVITSIIDASCIELCDGVASAFITAGTGTYQWNDPSGQTNPIANNLCTGEYNVVVTDSAGCTDTATAIVGSLPELTLAITPTNSTCGNTDGSATVNVSNGAIPYTYSWSSGDTLLFADSLASGIYVVTVTDDNGCSSFEIAIISDNNGPVITVVAANDITCNGGSDGSIAVSVSGGTAPFTYQWSNGSTGQVITGLVAGPYELTVTDSAGCIANKSVTLIQPDALSLLITTTDAICSNNDGSATVNVSGGNGGYTYSWSSGDTLPDADSLAADVYTVTVTDVSGCTDSASAAVSNAGGATITIDSIIDGGCGASLGSIYISLTGGSGIFTYLWSDGSINEDLVNVSSGTYNVTVTDTNNCIATASAHISGIPSVEASICLVTVDSATGKNLIVWEKTQTQGVKSYNIYKESSQINNYYWIGNVPVDTLSIFVDTLSDPTIRSWRYKMQVVDSCLNESELSADHKTMHLNINLGIPPAINLIWDHYEGDFSFSTYYVLRYTALTGWDTLGALASNLTSFTDPLPPPNEDLYYVVEVKHPTGCDPNLSKVLVYNSARSNVSNRLLPTGITEGGTSLRPVQVFPNPYSGVTQISYTLPEKADVLLEVFNVLGKKIQVLVNGEQNSGNYRYSFSAKGLGYSSGVYILKLRVGDSVYTKQLMEY
ncbi:MAG: T9SS type A sorting domain-containing protein [Cytophagales bacterium]|nr:T9SS type A sorting domain-containing protein [Cytophagales bacterium]